MRPQVFIRRTRLLSKGSLIPAALFSRPTCNLRRVPQNKLGLVPGIRWSSSTPPIVPPEDPVDLSPTSQDASPEDAEKPKLRRARVTTTTTKDAEPPELPENLEILSVHDDSTVLPDHSTSLPPPEILEEALNHLLITLHPQTQHQSLYSPGSLVEPSLGLYCPIEGGDYIVDATVQELARRTGAEVLVLDAAQLAAGQWGQFGKAANVLNFPHNPLHFSSLTTLSPSRHTTEDDEDDGTFQMFSPPQQMTFTLMTPSAVQNRAFVTRRAASENKPKVFFDSIVNLRAKPESSESFSPLIRKPRLIYIRDFPLIAPSSSAWYPALLASVRQRRRGPISRPTSPVLNPTTIIFGMTPSLASHAGDGSSGSANSLMNLLMNKNLPSPQVAQENKSENHLGSENELAEKAREKRLRHRLKRWEKGDSVLHEEFPPLPTDASPNGDEPQKPEIIVIGGPHGLSNFPPLTGPNLFPGGSNRMADNKSYFFRSSILVPNVRSLSKERSTRIARRREINQLTMRMGVGSVGGILEGDYDLENGNPGDEDGETTSIANSNDSMWTGWGNHIEVWSIVKKIADRAVGSVMSNQSDSTKTDRGTLEPTVISWLAVQDAWSAHQSTAEKRKLWMKDMSLSKVFRDAADVEGEEDRDRLDIDLVVDRIKNDPELDNHEQRLLSCIVDKAAMPTSFNQVHLPPHTIDSVRTIVSLPMLYPKAFQRGILKKHGMTGCLLFGPPGTGKTLIVRALAKEAGCRMLSISPSDVMDMYVGEGEKLVRAVFSLARKLSPCVIFLDEIDALFGARMSARDSGGAFAHRGVITEFMQEMDGLKSSREDNVIVIGATNRPFDLDDAVLRRLPRRLLVDLPGEKEREEILKILLRDESLAGDVDLRSLAKKTESFSGSDLKHLCVAAALDAVKESVLLPWAPEPYMKTTLARETTVLDKAASPAELPTSQSKLSIIDGVEDSGDLPHRSLELRNFTKALKEIVPSSSEMLGSLSELRKWNEEFGEGRRDRKRQHVWGRGRFGFIDKPQTYQEGVAFHLDQNSTD